MAEARDEFGLIARHFAPLAAGFPGALGLTDDAAVFSLANGHELVVTTDALVAGVHFLPDDPPDSIAVKALGVNLSDLAAMGATPLAYTLAAVLPRGTDEAWLTRFATALGIEQARHGIALAGGDTVATPGPLTVSVTAMGQVAAGRALRRSGARPGDRILVSGTLGDAALGLRVAQGGMSGLSGAARDFLADRYRHPRPRLALGMRLAAERAVTAAVDISDGLVADLGHVCEASGVAAVVETAALPLSPAARLALAADPALAVLPIVGGDDYELLLTAPDPDKALAAAAAVGVALCEIGRIEAGRGVRILRPDGTPLTVDGGGGWSHF